MEENLRIIISGGGTGGHIFPAVSIANAIKEQHLSLIHICIRGTGQGLFYRTNRFQHGTGGTGADRNP